MKDAILYRPATTGDFPEIWRIFRQVLQGGDTYPFSPESSAEQARELWFAPLARAFVAVDGGAVVGGYWLKPNQAGLGDHVANAGFIVDPAARGRGVGMGLGLHALDAARDAGFLAMQFNFVVSTNAVALALWRKLGFAVVGTVPKAFRHRTLGLVDVHVMHRTL